MKVIIIGAGASGLMAGISAAQNGASVTILEKNDRCGKKLLMTGNGKCNITNLSICEDNYYGETSEFALKVINKFNVNETIKFFNDIGVMTYDKYGYVYPMSNQAKTVLQALINKAGALGVNFVFNSEVKDIKKSQGKFVIHTDKNKYISDSLIITCGGKSYPKTGSDGSIYKIVNELGHKINNPVPALAGLCTKDKNIKMISGVRASGRVNLYVNDSLIIYENGEIQFTDYGVSGIAVFNVSIEVAQALKDNKKTEVIVELLPDLSKEQLKEFIIKSIENNEYMDVYQMLSGILNSKMADYILKMANINDNKKASKLSVREISLLVDCIKKIKYKIFSTKGFDNAQITHGGIDVNQINSETLQSKVCKGLYFAGEIINVTGRCGGYNLQFAWSSGFIAGKVNDEGNNN